MKALVCIDVQNDFVSGALGNPKAQEIVPKIIEFAKECRSKGWAIYATADTHRAQDWAPAEGGQMTLEASKVPPHCTEDTWGHQIVDGLVKDENRHVIIPQGHIFDKDRFGSMGLRNGITYDFGDGLGRNGHADEPLEEIVICGFVTDICVISNVLALRERFPNVPITVRADLCSGTTEEKHRAALAVMESCLVNVTFDVREEA